MNLIINKWWLYRDLRFLWNTRSNHAFIKKLRKLGCQIGTGVVFRDPRKTRIDVSRSVLITIGNNVDINTNFQILTHDWASFVFINKYHDFVNSEGGVSIGNNIYFGTNVIILKGVTIGDNCIIGAGSIVNLSIPANSVATGNPCRVVCSLDEYYEKRKQKGLAEAVEYVKAIRQRFGRDPLPYEMYEEFIYFVNNKNVVKYESEGVPVKKQLGVAYDDWIKTHKSLFKDFDEFLKYVDQQDQKPT